jgi:type VI secretion system secreted protein VgrG
MVACASGGATPAAPGMASGNATTASAGAANAFATAIGPAPSIHRPRSIAAIDLRSARAFSILAATTVTSTGHSVMSGNMGIFPGSARTGFPPAEIVDGTFYAGDGTARIAERDLTLAYNGAIARVKNPILVAGNLGGQTLTPGLYRSTSSLAISSGDLTLDGNGDRNAVFIFQMASTLTMTAGRQVILTNGANARNVFWAVGSSATFGTNCSFYGSVLAHDSISDATGTIMIGRLLARTGAVTMQTTTIKKPE